MISKVLKLHLITPIKTNQSILYYFQDPNRSIFGRLQVQQMRGKGELILPQRVLFGELLRELLELPPRSECERRAYCPIEANKAQSSHLNLISLSLFYSSTFRIVFLIVVVSFIQTYSNKKIKSKIYSKNL